MSSTHASADAANRAPRATALPMRREVVILPVADVDRAKSFYQSFGWRLDGEASAGGE